MTLDVLRGEFRELIGNPRVSELSVRQIDSYLIGSLVWLAEELEFDIQTEEIIGLSADQVEVPLPPDLLFLLWVEYNETRLDAISYSELDRENWRIQESGTPARYAVLGRRLILNPPPDSTAITADETLSWRYIGSGARLTAQGPQGLSEGDLQLLRYDAALAWLSSHPSEENNAKGLAYTARVNRFLPAARKRWQQPVPTHSPQIVTENTGRGAAR